jgi:RHS repeat-associated protein
MRRSRSPVSAWHDSVANKVNFRVNKGPVDSAATTGAPEDTSSNFRIGARSTTEGAFFDGVIDEVAFYKRVLTAGERDWLYNDGAGRTSSELTMPTTGLQTYGDATHNHAVTAMGSNSYFYDANGNQIKRVVNGQLYTLAYDAENRLWQVKVCQDSNKDAVCDSAETVVAAFTFDGDGNRVKSVVGTETTYFIGGYYEVTGSTVTKYYFAGVTRVAMRKYLIPQYDTLTFLLGDHLGSTSLAVDASDDDFSDIVETRYKPWGEVRSTTSSKTLPTRYTYTGQYSYVNDDATDLGNAGFGLMFYNARWYDPVTGRFAQADSVLADPVQGWDRYAIVNNNSLA